MINPNEYTTVNLTVKVKNSELVKFENEVNEKHNLISFSHLQNTDKMYQEDKVFKKVLKQYKDIKRLKDDYVIKNNYKYE